MGKLCPGAERPFLVSEFHFSIYRLVKIGLTPRSVALLERDFPQWQEWQREQASKQQERQREQASKQQERQGEQASKQQEWQREQAAKQQERQGEQTTKRHECQMEWEEKRQECRERHSEKRQICRKNHDTQRQKGKQAGEKIPYKGLRNLFGIHRDKGFLFGKMGMIGKIGTKKRRRQWENERSALLDSIFGLWGEPCSTNCVCQSPLTYFNKWEFTDYREEKWVEYLLLQGTLAHFVLLGSAPCLRQVLPKHAKGMKSLRLFLWESEFTEELEELLEELFEEYGLTSDIHFLEEDTGYRKLPTLSAVPCNVLDFTREPKVAHWAAAAGSIWLDFDGNEEKQRRIEGRKGAVQYFSLRKEWRQPH